MKKVSVIFPDGSIAELDESDVNGAISQGAKIYNGQVSTEKSTSMVFPDGSIADVPTNAIDGAIKVGAKKKVGSGGIGTTEDLNTTLTPSAPTTYQSQGGNSLSITTANNVFPTNNNPLPFVDKKITPTIVTPDGTVFPVKSDTIIGDAFTNSPESLQGLQQRVATKTTTPQDIQTLSDVSGKSLPATTAYIQRGVDAGNAVEVNENTAKTNSQITDGVNYFNQALGAIGLNVNADDIINSPEKSAIFLQSIEEIQKDNQDKINKLQEYKNQSIAAPGGFVVPNTPKIEPQIDDNLKIQTENLKDALTANIKKLTADEGLQKGWSTAQMGEALYKRLDPQGYQQNQDLRKPKWSSSNVQLNPLGYLSDWVMGSEQKNLEALNAEKAQYELAVNQGMRSLAIDKKAQGIANNNPDLIAEANTIIPKIKDDSQIVQSYPLLMKQEMAQYVNDRYAHEGGVLEGTEATTDIGKQLQSEGLNKYIVQKYLKEGGYYDKANYRDYADEVASNPNTYLANNSTFGGLGQSFLKPFVSIFNTVGDVLNIRTPTDIHTENVHEEMFPSKITGNVKNDISFNVLGHQFDMNTSNTLNSVANLGGYAAIAAATAGIGTEAGLTANTAERLGAYTSFFMPTVDEGLKEADKMGLTPAESWLYASMKGVMYAEGGKILDLGKNVIPSNKVFNEALAKVVTGISDKTLAEDGAKEAIDGAVNSWGQGLSKYGIGTAKGAAVLSTLGIGDNMLKLAFGDNNTDPNQIIPEAANAYFNGLFTMGLFGTIGLKGEIDNAKNSTYKGVLSKIADNQDAAQDILTIGLDKGFYNQEQYNQKMQILNTAIKAKSTLNDALSKTGVKLTADQKAAWVANATIEQSLRNQAEVPNTGEEDISKYNKLADNFKDQNSKILDGLTFNKFLEPNTELYDAQKEHQQALTEFTNNQTPENEQTLLDKKAIVDKIQNTSLANELLQPYIKSPLFTGLDTPEQKIKMIAEQAQNVSPNGQQDASGFDNKPSMIRNFGEPLVNAAIAVHPLESLLKEKPAPTEVSDTEILPTFKKVKSFIPEENLDETQNVITKINNAENINVNDLSKAEDNLYTALDKAPEAAHLIEPLILKIQNYPDEFKTKTEVSTTTEKVPIEGSFAAKSKPIEIKPALEQSTGSDATIQHPDGSTAKGKLSVKSGQYVLDVPDGGTQQIIGEKAITDKDLTLPSEDEMDNPIQFDKDGNVESVTFKTHKGDLITIHDPEKALNFAIQIQADKIGNVPDAAFEKAYQEVQKEVKTEIPISSQLNTNKNENVQEGNISTGVQSDQKNTAKGESSQGQSQQYGEAQVLNQKGVANKTAPLKNSSEQPEKVNDTNRKSLIEKLLPEERKQYIQAKFDGKGDEFLNKKNINNISDADISNSSLQDNKNIGEYVLKAKSVLNQLYPDAKLEVYDNEKDYEKAGGEYGTRGFAILDKNGNHRILLNLEQIKEDKSGKTAFHEVIHPIVYDAFGVHSDELIPIWNEIADSMKDVKGMDKVFQHISFYDHNKIAPEGVTETLTQIAAGNIDIKDIPKSTANKIIDLINRLFDTLGIKLKINSVNDFADIAKKIHDAFNNSDAEGLKDIVKSGNIDKYIRDLEKTLSEKDISIDDFKNKIEELKNEGFTIDEIKDALKSRNLSDEQIKNILGQDVGIGNNPPPKEEKVKEPPEKTNIVSRKGLKADYGFSKRFARRSDQEVADETTDRLQKKADANGISIQQQAANEVAAMKNIKGQASEHDIMTAAYYVRNLDDQIENANKNGEDASHLIDQREEGLSILRKLGSQSGFNLQLFSRVYKVTEEGKLEVTRAQLKRDLGVDDIPKTMTALKLSKLSDEDKAKVEPYVKAIETLDKTLKDINSRAEKQTVDLKSKDVQDYINAEVEKRLKEQKSNTPKARQKISQNLKEFAQKIRTTNELDKFIKSASGETVKSSIFGDVDFKELAAQALEYLAKGVEKGEDLGKLIKEASVKFRGKFDSGEFGKALSTIVSKSSLPDKDEVIDKIKAIANNEGAKLITADMVKHGLVKDVVNDYIHSDTPSDKVIKEATKELKQHLPDVTESQVEDALLKRGDFRGKTKMQLNKEIADRTSEVKKLATKSTNNRELGQDVRKEKQGTQEIQIAKNAQDFIDEIKADDSLSDETKKEHIKAIEKQRDEELQNTRQGILSNLKDSIDNHISELTSKQNDAIVNKDSETAKNINEVKKDLQDLSNHLRPNEEKLKDQIDKADQDLQAIIRSNFKTPFEKDLKDIQNKFHENWQKTADELDRQSLLDKAIASRKEAERRILAGQFTEIPRTPLDVKLDKVLAQKDAEAKKAWTQLNSMSLKAKEQHKKNQGVISKWLNLRRQWLIMSFSALEKVAGSGLSKPIIDPFIKQTAGRISGLFTGIHPAEFKRIFGTYRQFKDDKSANDFMGKMNNAYIDSIINFDKAQKKYGKDSNEANIAEDKMKAAEISHLSALPYLFINANSGVDIAQIITKGATDFDAKMGRYQQSLPKERTKMEGLGFWLESVNRTHAAIKSISHRQALLDDYIENLQIAQKESGSIDNEARQRAWDAAVLSSEAGRFGENTKLSDLIAKGKNAENKAVRNTTKFLFPVAKISINIGKQGLDMAFPFVEAGAKLSSSALKGIKLNAEDKIEFKNFASKWYNGLKRGFNELPLEQKKYINTLISRGLFGLAQYALVGYGLSKGTIKYGGAYDSNDPYHKKPVMGSDGKPLGYGEWEIDGKRVPKILNLIINHSPYSLPASLAAVTHNELQRKDKKGMQISNAFTKTINEVWQRLPFNSAIDYGKALLGNRYAQEHVIANEVPTMKNTAEFFDKNSKGETRKVNIKSDSFWKETENIIQSNLPGFRNKLSTKK